MAKKVFVTGGTGFVGYYIVRQLIEAGGYEVTVLARQDSPGIHDLHALDRNIKIQYGDIKDGDSYVELCADHEIVIHAAALISFDSQDLKNIYKTNVDGTTNIVNACLAGTVKKLIYISSIAAISDRPDEINHDETIPWDLKTNHSPYAISKHSAEMEIWRGSAEGLEVGILNPSVILGRWHKHHHSMQLFEAIKRGLSFYPSGSTGWVDVRDVASGVLAYVEKGMINQQIIITGHNISYQEMINRIARSYGNDIPRYALSGLIGILSSRLYSIAKAIVNRKSMAHVGIIKSLFKQARYDHKRSVEALGLNYRSIEETIQWVTGDKD